MQGYLFWIHRVKAFWGVIMLIAAALFLGPTFEMCSYNVFPQVEYVDCLDNKRLCGQQVNRGISYKDRRDTKNIIAGLDMETVKKFMCVAAVGRGEADKTRFFKM